METGFITVRAKLRQNIMISRKWLKRLKKAKPMNDVAKVLKKHCRIHNIDYLQLNEPIIPSLPNQVQCYNCRRVSENHKRNALLKRVLLCPIDNLTKRAFLIRQCSFHKPDLIERALV